MKKEAVQQPQPAKVTEPTQTLQPVKGVKPQHLFGLVSLIAIVIVTAVAVFSQANKAHASDDLEPESAITLEESTLPPTDEEGGAMQWIRDSLAVVKAKIGEIMATAEELEAKDKAEKEAQEQQQEETPAEDEPTSTAQEKEVPAAVKLNPTVSGN